MRTTDDQSRDILAIKGEPYTVRAVKWSRDPIIFKAMRRVGPMTCECTFLEIVGWQQHCFFDMEVIKQYRVAPTHQKYPVARKKVNVFLFVDISKPYSTLTATKHKFCRCAAPVERKRPVLIETRYLVVACRELDSLSRFECSAPCGSRLGFS